MTASAQARKAFLDFFKARGHAVRPSGPLIPQGDPTLMFNSAGMVPFKPYFLGLKTDLKRAASCQKCFRTTDIDRVGTTLRHLTFFEMLGNFSFGDYFKEDAVAWAWEFLTKEMGLDPGRLHPTVFTDDAEAEALWRKQDIKNPVVRLGEDSNFWAVGPTGPCGPCSEVYFDRGPEASCGKPSCAVGCDCDRYLEVWNLVFMQFDRRPGGEMKPLPRKNIDTGMGLERLALVLQGKASPFETDLFSPLVDGAQDLLGVRRDGTPERELAFRVISDHFRAAVMLMSEGVIPSNTERGYVLRRLVRRAMRYGQLLGRRDAFLHRLAPSVRAVFPDLPPEALGQVAATMKAEEEGFLATLENGEAALSKLLAASPRILPGDKAFWLYETYGFPLELTREICAQKGVSVDEEGFQAASQAASETARASWKGSGEKGPRLSGDYQTEFTGYDRLEGPAQVVAVELQGDEGVVVLDRTPFYPEGGGQVGDEGLLLTSDGRRTLARVTDTQRQGTAVLHLVRGADPNHLAPGLKVLARVDAVRRGYVTPHHTGTHLLNEALRRVLGAHVRQAGSYVGADKLRFDFTHPKALDPETLRKIEGLVADEIRKGDPVRTKVDSAEKARELGAVTLLGEDYGERPRFVLIGAKGWDDPKDRFSLELCGGTHCATTAEVGPFRVVKESSASAGVRRIEALAGRAVEDYERLKAAEEGEALSQLLAREAELLSEATALGGDAQPLPPSERSPARLRVRERELKELIARLRQKKLSAQAESGRRLLEAKGLRLAAQRLEGADPKSLRALSDKAKAELGSGLVFLAAPSAGRLSFVLAATPDLAGRGVDASRIAKAFAAARGGSAGGRADFAQGGAADGDWEGLLKELVSHLP